MIQVIASIKLKPGCRDDFLARLNENVPKVKAEEGCLAYDPSIDLDSG
jgi:quinol monooxygenase YgiN